MKRAAFTLTELLVSIAILVAIVLLVSRLFLSASSLTSLGNKRMDTDAQIRPLFERIATDLAQMTKRSDLDFFGKGTATPNSSGGPMSGNDQFAFYSLVPGYHPSSVSPGPVSLVAYRVSAHKLERMAKGLIWNGDSANTTDCNGSTTPMVPLVFLPVTISATWPTATSKACDPDYELTGPYVFRFEYYYILKNGLASVIPWDATAGHTTVNGLQDVSAIAICLAALDPKTRLLAPDTDLTALVGAMNDFQITMNPGGLLAQWQATLYSSSAIPRSTLSAVRLYERTFMIAPNP